MEVAKQERFAAKCIKMLLGPSARGLLVWSLSKNGPKALIGQRGHRYNEQRLRILLRRHKEVVTRTDIAGNEHAKEVVTRTDIAGKQKAKNKKEHRTKTKNALKKGEPDDKIEGSNSN